jgi:hypothetical protein
MALDVSPARYRASLVIVILLLVMQFRAFAQNSPTPPDQLSLAETVKQLQQQVNDLRTVVTELRDESERYRSETQALRQELRSALSQHAIPDVPASTPKNALPENAAVEEATPRSAPDTTGTTPERLAKLEEEYDLLSGKVDDQYQTKIESASKYRVRLSGIVLLNLFENRGNVASADVPGLAANADILGRANSFGGSLRQSQFGLEVFGPTLAGARTRGEVQFDFAGGFPATPNGVTLGIMRLRTGTIHADWPRTSIVAGQDVPFFSPLSPTSFATLAEPAMAYAGNLWSWIPQVRVEHRFLVLENSSITLQGGILDPLSGESPYSIYSNYALYDRSPQAGEFSRQPGYAARVAWSSLLFGQQATIGAGGYYSRQNWGFGRNVNGWTGTLDWTVPFGKAFTWSGEFYRGQALGGLGGGLYRSALFSGIPTDPASQVRGLDTVGGWSQVKFKPLPKLEFNLAAGEDNPFANEVRSHPFDISLPYAQLVRNQNGLVNVIYRPRSNLLFSAEYRRIQTYRLYGARETGDHVNLAMGILF